MLQSLNLKSEHHALDCINRLEAAVFAWKEKIMEQESGKSPVRTSWSFIKDPMSELDKTEALSDRAGILIQHLKNSYPNLPQTFLNATKIQYGKVCRLNGTLRSNTYENQGLAFFDLTKIDLVMQSFPVGCRACNS